MRIFRFSVILIICFVFTGLHAESSKTPKPDQRYKWIRLQTGTEVKLPHNYRPRPPRTLSFTGGPWQISLYSNSFSQGEVIYIEITPYQKETVSKWKNDSDYDLSWHSLRIDGKVHPLQSTSFGYRTFASISPLRQNDGLVQWTFKDEEGTGTKTFTFTVYKTNFPVYKSSLNLGKYSNLKTMKKPEVIQRIKNDRKLKLAAFSKRGPFRFSDKLAHARDNHYVTSPFYSTRITSRYEFKNGKKVFHKPSKHVHRGLDLRGRPGDVAMAMADGQVVLAENLFYEGNFVMINHGNGWISGYMHLNRIFVKTGDSVKAGDIIGEPGATGAVTGAHLHWSLWHNGIPLQPVSMLGLPVRN